ncbi:hypothetical protein GCM10009612_05300 [Streptomyces beijiangensis]
MTRAGCGDDEAEGDEADGDEADGDEADGDDTKGAGRVASAFPPPPMHPAAATSTETSAIGTALLAMALRRPDRRTGSAHAPSPRRSQAPGARFIQTGAYVRR